MAHQVTDLFETCCPHCHRPYEEKAATVGFPAFWASIPHKIGKANAEKAWRKLSAADRAIAAERVGAFYDWFAKTYPTASAIHPATYLNSKRWLDEPISGQKSAVTESAREAILKALRSPVPSVREYARAQAEKHGIRIEA